MKQEEFGEFFSAYKDKWLGSTMTEAKEGMKEITAYLACTVYSFVYSMNVALNDIH